MGSCRMVRLPGPVGEDDHAEAKGNRRDGADEQLGLESARATRRVGDIQARLGNYDLAEAAYRKAIEKYQALVSQILRKTAKAHKKATSVAANHGRIVKTPKAPGRQSRSQTKNTG